jgi:hypothetical protein
VDRVVRRARRNRFFFVSHAARKTGVEQHAQSRTPKVFSQIALLGAPNNGCRIEFPDSWCNHRPSQRASAEARKDEGVGFPVKDSVDIHELDPSSGQLGPIAGFTHVRFGPKQLRRLFNRFFEREMFEGVQRVVVNKDPYGALFGKEVCGVFDCGAQSIQTR